MINILGTPASINAMVNSSAVTVPLLSTTKPSLGVIIGDPPPVDSPVPTLNALSKGSRVLLNLLYSQYCNDLLQFLLMILYKD